MKAGFSLVLGSLLLTTAFAATAGDKALAKALKERDGKTTTLVLASGTELTGKVSNVSDDSVKLSELSGKEFYDAVIDLDHVQAVVFRARER